ncbi:MAG: polysaccharide biosynthesis tyrosine autokinase [Ignavibacteria bacterium]|nr:polysaccharide biosynthesis tyrosine autokinase [Ignavibacteria bacterium]
MKNSDFNEIELLESEFEGEKHNIMDYFSIIRNNLLPIVLIFAVSMIVTYIYIKNYPVNYRATTIVRIDKPRSGILEQQSLSFNLNFAGGTERFLMNQIEIMKSYYIRDIVAKTILDTMKNVKNIRGFTFLTRKVSENESVLLSQEDLRRKLFNQIKIDLKKNVDAVTVSLEGFSFFEIQMVVNIYSNVFVEYSKEINKEDLTNVKKFLEDEKDKKYKELTVSESALEDFQKKSGFVALDEQSKALIESITNYDQQKNLATIDLRAGENELYNLKKESEKSDPKLYDYISGQIAQPYMIELQRQIAELEVKRDIDLSTATDTRLKEKITTEAKSKLEKLNKTLDEKTEILRVGLLAETPEGKRVLSQKIIDGTLRINALQSKIKTINGIMKKYEGDFNKLPETNIEFAKLERNRKSNEKLYLALEEKYQEATINERSRLGYAELLDPGYDSVGPVSPNKNLILLTGVIIGISLGLGFAFARNYLDKSIKSPEQIEASGASVLSWIPSFKELVEVHSPDTDFIVELKPSSSASEAFKALRTRIQYSKIESEPLKTILVTSSIPSEGKTIVSANIAGSFSQTGKRTLLLDCDLRKPRIHNVMQCDRYPGLSDKLFENVSFEDVIRKTKLENLSFITSGTIPPNPSELLGSLQMKNLLEELKGMFDIIVIDSPPLISVTDSEILFNICDGTILVSRANVTPFDAFLKTYRRLYKINQHNMLGCVLNDFTFKGSYGYYYNYYYYYSKPDNLKGRKAAK